MNNQIFKNIKLVVIGLVLSVGISYTHASIWSNPPANAPLNNTFIPLNVGNDWQQKSASLAVGNFVSNLNAQLDGVVYLNGIIKGGKTISSTVRFGSTDMGYNVDLNVLGQVNAQKNIVTSTLSGTQAFRRVCADSSGTLVFCVAECSDGEDNDGNDIKDYANGDPGCYGPDDDDESSAPAPVCAVTAVFEGSTRWGRVEFNGGGSHPEYTVTVTLRGTAATPSTGGDDREVFFTIPEGETDSFVNGQNCNAQSIGCEIEATTGFAEGEVTSVTPNIYGNGLVCW